MVRNKAQVRGRVESENAEKQKKIAQLQDFVARFSAGTRASQVQSRKKAMEKLQLADFADVKMEGFSSGQKQKVSIARALLHDPKVVIFDEPTTGLDVLTAKTVLDLLRIMREEGRTVIVSTHVMPMVEDICDRVGIIFDGKLHGDAPPREILQSRHAKSLDEVFFQLAAESEGGH